MTVLSRTAPGAVLAGAVAAQTAVSIVNFGLPAVGPELQGDFDLTLFELGAVLTAGLLGAGVTLVAAGILVDRVGARAAMLAGTAVGSLGLALAAAAPAKETLFLALFVFGIGSSVVPIAGTGALFRAYPPARRGWALGVRQTAVPLGGAVAAVLFPALYALGGAGLTLAASAVAVAITGTWFTVVVSTDRPDRRQVGRGSLATILRAPGVPTLLAVAACYVVVLQALLAFLVPAVESSGHSELTASIAYFAVNLAAGVARIMWGSVADRGGGARRVRTLVEVGVVASVGALVFGLALHAGPGAVVLAAVAFGLGALGWNALVYLSAGERVDPALAGRSVAVAATVVFVLSGIATPVLGGVIDLVGWDALWIACAALAALGASLAFRLPAQAVGNRA